MLDYSRPCGLAVLEIIDNKGGTNTEISSPHSPGPADVLLPAELPPRRTLLLQSPCEEPPAAHMISFTLTKPSHFSLPHMKKHLQRR